MKIGSYFILLFFIISVGFAQKSTGTSSKSNLLSELSPQDLGTFNWLNTPEIFKIKDGTLTIETAKGSDFFNNPEDGQLTGNAPFLFREMEGDFVAKALVTPDFSSQWNAIALMVYLDSDHWIKFAFENSDATGPSIVTVVTKELSDDANGVMLTDTKAVWLKLIRKGNNYAMLWSKNDSDYKMARLTTLPKTPSIKIGIEAQCPVGPTATHKISYFGLAKKTVKDMRKGF